MAKARFNNNYKGQPNYEPVYGKHFTERQKNILDGKIPLSKVRVNEISLIKNKAFHIQDIESYEIAESFYLEKIAPEYTSPYTPEEARTVLEQLTPWEIRW